MLKRKVFSLLAVLLATAGAVAGCARGAPEKGGQPVKVSRELTELHGEYSAFVAAGKGGRFQSRIPLVQVVDDRVVVDATAAGEAGVLKADLEKLGMQQAVAFGRMVSGQFPIAAIPRLEALSSLSFVRAAMAMTQGGPQPLAPGPPGR